MEPDDAKRQLRNAIVMAWLDGEITDDERRFIKDLRDQLGIAKEDFDAIVAEVKADPKRLSVPKGPEGRQTLEQLIAAAQADGVINETERHLLVRVASYLGLGETESEQLIAAETDPDLLDAMEAQVQEFYTHWASWDAAAREQKLTALSAHGRHALIPLLRIMESYRTPDGMDSTTDLKTAVAAQLGKLADTRAVYYLAQQVNIGDTDDEITNASLRLACASAIGQITGETFADPPVDTARLWWRDTGRRTYNKLAM